MAKIKTAQVTKGWIRDRRQIVLRFLYLFLLIPVVFIAYPLATPGIIVMGDFPYLDTPEYATHKLWTWIDKGSYPALENISRFSIIGLWYVLSHLQVTSDLISKLIVIMGFLLASFSFYFSFLFFFKDKFSVTDITSLKVAAILGSLFFAYNPWSFERIAHWYLWLGYCLLPLFFISVVYVFRNPKSWKHLLSTLVLWSIASTTPHMAVFYGVIFILTFSGFILNRVHIYSCSKKKIKFDKNTIRSTIRLALPFLLTIFLFALVNMYWIYPYLMASQTRSISPNYLTVQENIEILSRESDFLNVFRLVANWLHPDSNKPSQETLSYPFWLLATFSIPILAFSTLATKKKILLKYGAIFSSFAIVGITLSMGTRSPFGYVESIMSSPMFSGLVWLFRDPDKWSFLIAFGYAFLLGINSYRILLFIRKKRRQHKHKIIKIERKNMISACFLFLMIGAICLYSYPVYNFIIIDNLRPLILPHELDKLNSYLSTITQDKVFYLPYPHDETYWNKLNRVGNVYQMHSIKPSIESSGSSAGMSMASTNYYNYLKKSIMENVSINIDNFIYPLGTAHLIFHNDTWDKGQNSFNLENVELLKNLLKLESLENIDNIGFYKIFKIANDNDLYNNNIKLQPGQVNILEKNVAAIGGLASYSSLSSLQSFTVLNSAVFFLDNLPAEDFQDHSKPYDYLLISKSSLSPTEYELMLSLVDENNIIQTIGATNHYNPSKVWSKAGALDPQNGYFHPVLDSLGIENWEFDYGQGLVITQAMGQKISIPVEISENGEYDLFMRYLENQKGGLLKVYVDNNLINELDTLHDRDNSFVWEKLAGSSSPLYLTKGKHTLTLENAAGLNAVNIFAVLPAELTEKLLYKSKIIANNANNIYLLEAESEFHNANGGRNSSSIQDYSLFKYDAIKNIDNGIKGAFNKTATGQFVVPSNSDLFSLRLLADASSNANGTQLGQTSNHYSLINNLDIMPANSTIKILSSDFEGNKESVSLGTLRHQDWINHNKETLSTSPETQKPISGNTSLGINVKEADAAGWSFISTDFFPINDKLYYEFSSDVSARGVNQLHSKVVYYDVNKERMKSEFMSNGRDGNFDDTVSHSILPPIGSKYLRFEFLSLPKGTGNYFIDNVNFEQIEPKKSLFDNNFRTFEYINHISDQHMEQNKSSSKKNSNYNGIIIDPLRLDFPNQTTDNQKSLSKTISGTALLQTKPIPVRAGSIYNYTISVEGKNLDSFSAVASFGNGSGIIENSTRYGPQASRGSVLSLSPGSEIYTELDILKPANYSIAVRASACENCSFIKLDIRDKEYNNIISRSTISLKDNDDAEGYDNKNKNNTAQQLRWLYPDNNTWLDEGKYEFRISSDSKADLDLMAIYSSDEKDANTAASGAKSPEDIFDTVQSNAMDIPAASISEYKKINPTKHEVKIDNAVRPYIMSFAESHDPLWVAYAGYDGSNNTNNVESSSANNNENIKDQFKIQSMPLYSIINGFYINKTGDYTITIEYEPQKWFMMGGAISIATIVAIFAFVTFKNRKSLFGQNK